MPRPKRQLKRAAARDTQDPGQARRPGRRRAQRQQTNINEQDVQAQLAPPQPQAVQLPQAAPQHQAALLQQAAPPQQAQDQAEQTMLARKPLKSCWSSFPQPCHEFVACSLPQR